MKGLMHSAGSGTGQFFKIDTSLSNQSLLSRTAHWVLAKIEIIP